MYSSVCHPPSHPTITQVFIIITYMSNLDVGMASITIHPTIIHVLVFARLTRNYHRTSPRHCLRLAWPRFCRATAKGAASLTCQGKWHSSLACHCSWRGKARLPRHPSRHGKAWTFPVDQSRASSTYVQHKQNKMREYSRLDISSTHAQVFKLLHKT